MLRKCPVCYGLVQGNKKDFVDRDMSLIKMFRVWSRNRRWSCMVKDGAACSPLAFVEMALGLPDVLSLPHVLY